MVRMAAEGVAVSELACQRSSVVIVLPARDAQCRLALSVSCCRSAAPLWWDGRLWSWSGDCHKCEFVVVAGRSDSGR